MKVRGFGHFFVPKSTYHRIFQFLFPFSYECIVGEHAGHFGNGARRFEVAHERKHHVAHLMFEHRPDHGWVSHHFIENGDHFLCRKIFLFFGAYLQNIESDRALGISRIEINYIVSALFGNMLQDVFYKVAVRINDANAFTVLNILYRQVFDKHGFTTTGFTNDIQMTTPVGTGHFYDGFFATINCATERDAFFRHVYRRRRFAGTQPVDMRRFGMRNR